jgi:hypothetical protein
MTAIWGYSSAGRALEWHSRGQRFDPAYLHQKRPEIVRFQVFFFFEIETENITQLPGGLKGAARFLAGIYEDAARNPVGRRLF